MVGKTRSTQDIRSLIEQGILLVGENRVQEAEQKFPQLVDLSFEKHLIGSLQTNKQNKALQLFDVIQSIESLDQVKGIIAKLNVMNISKKIFIQVNTSQEDTKHGIRNTEEIFPMLDLLLESPQITVQGLMTIGAMSDQEKIVRISFNKLYSLREKISTSYSELSNLKLSMGMSQDFEWAIQEGSDMIRLGRILFT